jgi:hypothetical protein
VLKDRPRGRGAEGRIMPEAQELTQMLHRGARLQPLEVLKRLSRPRLQLCDFFWTMLHKPPTCVLQRAARVPVRRTRLQGRHEYSVPCADDLVAVRVQPSKLGRHLPDAPLR